MYFWRAFFHERNPTQWLLWRISLTLDSICLLSDFLQASLLKLYSPLCTRSSYSTKSEDNPLTAICLFPCSKCAVCSLFLTYSRKNYSRKNSFPQTDCPHCIALKALMGISCPTPWACMSRQTVGQVTGELAWYRHCLNLCRNPSIPSCTPYVSHCQSEICKC